MSRAVAASEGIAPTLLENPWYPGPEDRLGFYGCSAGGGRIVRVGLIGQPRRKPPRALMVDCPACGLHHQIKPTWRRSVEVDEDQEPELVIDIADVETLGGEEQPMGMGSRRAPTPAAAKDAEGVDADEDAGVGEPA